jgi:hypothetical protein
MNSSSPFKGEDELVGVGVDFDSDPIVPARLARHAGTP